MDSSGGETDNDTEPASDVNEDKAPIAAEVVATELSQHHWVRFSLFFCINTANFRFLTSLCN